MSELRKQHRIKYVQIQNNKNENNCYINVLIHTFAHLTNVLECLLKMNESNVFKQHELLCVFVKMLMKYKLIKYAKNDNECMINPIFFKNELNSYFKGKKEFQLNEKGDANELLLFIINAFHSCYVEPQSGNLNENEKECYKQCISHKSFYIKLTEYTNCMKCHRKTNTKYDNNYFIYEIYVEETFKYITDNNLSYSEIYHQLFTLSKTVRQLSLIYCDKCKDNSVCKELKCEHIGNVFIVNCIISRKFSMEHICYLYFLISRIVKIGDLFELDKKTENKTYMLIGMTLYFRSHYLCVFYENENECFVLYDDTKNKEFNNWKMLIEYLIKNNYYPVLLFYQEVNNRNNDSLQGKNFQMNESLFINEMSLCKEMDSKNETKLCKGKEDKDNFNYNNDDVWECESCSVRNSYDCYTCKGCNKLNKTVKMIHDSKIEMDMQTKKNYLEKTEMGKYEYEEKKIKNEDKGTKSMQNRKGISNSNNGSSKKDNKIETDKGMEFTFNDMDNIKPILSHNEWLCPLCNRIINKKESVCSNCRSVNEDLYYKKETHKSQASAPKLLKGISLHSNQNTKHFCIQCKRIPVPTPKSKCLQCKQKDDQNRDKFTNDIFLSSLNAYSTFQ